MLGDLLCEIDNDYRLGKSDSVEVCLSSKKDATEIFFPYYNEKIDVISQFDKSLKYVTFKITKFSTQLDRDVAINQKSKLPLSMIV